jgi:hypothetical protein
MRRAAARGVRRRRGPRRTVDDDPDPAGSFRGYVWGCRRYGRAPQFEPDAHGEIRGVRTFDNSRYFHAVVRKAPYFHAAGPRELRWFLARFPGLRFGQYLDALFEEHELGRLLVGRLPSVYLGALDTHLRICNAAEEFDPCACCDGHGRTLAERRLGRP